MQVYVKAKSKKEINEKMAAGIAVRYLEYKMLDCNEGVVADLPLGAVVKIYDKMVGGNPYAKAYGNVAVKKDGAKYLK